MEDDKEHKHHHGKAFSVSKAGAVYFCDECGAEVQSEKACPLCKKEINWSEIMGQVRPY
ncbi:MAG: hypothetical protein MUO19_06475 [Dehalococcoidales bacterium]|nr:hypothetical protein [Dehalococcoidales bacterium]